MILLVIVTRPGHKTLVGDNGDDAIKKNVIKFQLRPNLRGKARPADALWLLIVLLFIGTGPKQPNLCR